MKKIIIMSLCLLSVGVAQARGSSGHSYSSHSSHAVSVSGYTKSNGTHVAPSHRTSADSTKSNNWSTKGNINPYTGKAGTKNQ